MADGPDYHAGKESSFGDRNDDELGALEHLEDFAHLLDDLHRRRVARHQVLHTQLLHAFWQDLHGTKQTDRLDRERTGENGRTGRGDE